MKSAILLGVMLVLIVSVSAEYYIDIQADYINESKVTVTDVDIHRLAYNTWRLNSTNANYAIQRAKVIEQLYSLDYKLINDTSGVTKISVSNSSDSGRNGIYGYISTSARGDDVCNAGDPRTNVKISFTTASICSGWSNLYAVYSKSSSGADPGSYSYYYMGTSSTNAVIGYDDLGASTSYEIGTDTTADDSIIANYNLTHYIADHANAWSGSATAKAILFCDSNTSSVAYSQVSTTCINDFGGPFAITRSVTNVDYYNNYSVPFTTGPELTISFFTKTPLNGSNVNITSLLEFELFHVNISATCNITNNGMAIEYVSGLTNGTYNFSFNTSYWASGWNNLNITCNDSSDTATDIKSLFVDEIQPEILYINVTQSGVSVNLSNNYLETTIVNFTSATNDTNNYFFSINITKNNTGAQYLYFQNTSISDYYVYNNQTDLSDWPAGLYKVVVTAKDAHTKNKIDLKSEKFTYQGAKGAKFDDKVTTYLSTSEIDSFELITEIDRQKFNIRFKPNVKKFTMNVEGSESIEYLGDRFGYQGHFIIDGKYWYDLENDDGAIIKKVQRVSQTKYLVEMEKPSSVNRVIFNSVGIINTNIETRYFSITLLNVTVRDEITNECLDEVTAIFSSASTAFNTTINCSTLVSWPNLDDYTIRYYKTGYPARRAYYSFDGSPEPSLTLYLANYTTSQDISFAVVDQYDNRVPGATITIEKFILAESSFKPIIALLTNINGEASTPLIPDTELYRYVVTYEGVVEWNNSDPNGEPIYTGDTSFTFRIYTGEDIYEISDLFETLSGSVTSYLNVSTNNTGYFRFAFLSDTSRQFCLIINNMTDNGRISTQCLTGTSGLITYNFNLSESKILQGVGVLNYTGSFYLVDISSLVVIVNQETNPFKESSSDAEKWLIAIILIIILTVGLASHSEFVIIGAGAAMVLSILLDFVHILPQYKVPMITGIIFFTAIITALAYQGGKK